MKHLLLLIFLFLTYNFLIGQSQSSCAKILKEWNTIIITDAEIKSKLHSASCDLSHKEVKLSLTMQQVDSLREVLIDMNKKLAAKDYYYIMEADLLTGKTELIKEYKFFNQDNSSGNTIYGDELRKMSNQ